MKNCLLILISLLFINCSKNEKLEGFWYKLRKDNNNPVLIKFENNKLIDYTFYDTLTYSHFRNKIVIKNEFNEKREFKIKLDNSQLILIEPVSDTINSEYRRKKSSYFIKDLIADKSLKVDLPSGNGIQRMYGQTSLFEPLLISDERGSLIANFRNEKITINKDFYKVLKEKGKYNFYEKRFVQISLIVDKYIKIKDLELIKKQLKLAGYNSIELILDNNKYEFIKSFRLKLPPLLEKDLIEYKIDSIEYILPPAPAKIDKEHTLLLEIGNNDITINSVTVNEEELKDEVQKSIKKDSKLNIVYSFTDNSVYQDYINTLDIVYNSIIDLRKDFLKSKYDIDYYSDDLDNRGKLIESKEKFRFTFFNIDNAER